MLRFSLLARNQGIEWTVDTMVNESLIPRGRNNLVAKFLHNTTATHLMFIDADIRFDPYDILKLLEFDKDIIGMPYAKKLIDWKIETGIDKA